MKRSVRRSTLVLGIERAKNWIPIPKSKEKKHEGDKLVIYGSLNVLKTQFEEK